MCGNVNELERIWLFFQNADQVLAKRSLQLELTLTHTFALPMNMLNWKISQTLLIFEQSLYAHSSRESFTARLWR